MLWTIASSIVVFAFASHSKASASTIVCPLIFDGRVPQSANGSNFSSGMLPYNPSYDLGANLTWAEVLVFPNVTPSLFDTAAASVNNRSTKAVEVTITNASIFTPSPGDAQTGFRRAELLPEPANVTASTTGHTALHWSLMADAQRPLNYSHEYMLLWLESANYAADQMALGTGTLYGTTATEAQSHTLFVRSNDKSNQSTLWSTNFVAGVWHNFALELDFTSNQTQIYYSMGNSSLMAVSSWLSDDLSGNGEYHFGVLKKPTGNVSDIVYEGYQEGHFHEGIIYGGIFEESTRSGCLSTGA